ncbi:hypothetical protein ERC79_16710 [Rhodococcus sp. ABRD24]|uniref:hypothetical protein n=1 Tax=Rhodococcus sp. ABRD24 TaxID=2507582 RepID=UPI00103C0991|nr:hypothetical protein [Rhodococcus sp. ABRD24]QBJ97395.1 hypothetical protein ERC79_16710 [Rhodococcus sp. ABRD24]
MSGVAGLIVVIIGAWLFGSVIARIGGALLVIIGLLRIASDHASPRMWAFVGIGVALWLFGQWLWALKHKLWRSSLALSVFSLPVLDAVADPHEPDSPVTAGATAAATPMG